jgi:pyruvate dehydrogenase E1 component beta subunit
LIAVGKMVQQAVDAAEILHQQDGLSVEVIDPRTIVPLDRKGAGVVYFQDRSSRYR